MPQQRRIRVKTSGSKEHENDKVVITVSDEDADKLDGLDLWVMQEKEARRKIDNLRIERP